MKAVGVIPARFASTRFPGKPLALVAGKPMVIRVAERASAALGRENTVIATDDDRIAAAAKEHGFQAVMTSEKAPTGTDRVAEVATKMDADVYLNIQGDEPLIDPADVRRVLEIKLASPGRVVNAMARLAATEDPADLTIPKVVFSTGGNLVYMSRLPIPGTKSPSATRPEYWKQVCIYAFSREELAAYAGRGEKCPMERYEDIEILRFLDLGYSVRMVETVGESMAIDLPEHVAKVERRLRELGLD